MILVLGLLTVVPTSIITSITSRNIQSNLINQADQSLVLSSDQLALSINSFIQTNLDITRTAALDPAFISYLGQPASSAANQGLLLPRDTDLQRVGAATLLALLKREILSTSFRVNCLTGLAWYSLVPTRLRLRNLNLL